MEFIGDLLMNTQSVTVLHLTPDCNHFEALSTNLSNVYNGTRYGVMKTNWNDTEIINFGNMILFNTLKMCLIETPNHVIISDLIK